jgi:hypothetical protein
MTGVLHPRGARTMTRDFYHAAVIVTFFYRSCSACRSISLFFKLMKNNNKLRDFDKLS